MTLDDPAVFIYIILLGDALKSYIQVSGVENHVFWRESSQDPILFEPPET